MCSSDLKGRHYNLVVSFVNLKNSFVEALHIISQVFPFLLPFVMLPPNEVLDKRVTELFEVRN